MPRIPKRAPKGTDIGGQFVGPKSIARVISKLLGADSAGPAKVATRQRSAPGGSVVSRTSGSSSAATIAAKGSPAALRALGKRGDSPARRAVISRVDPEQAARDRQAKIDAARKVASGLAEADELAGNEAPAGAFAARLRASDLDATTVNRLIAAYGRGDRAALTRALNSVAKRHGLTPGARTGEVVPFRRGEQNLIDGSGGTPTHAVVVRPGYTATIDGERVRLGKTDVEPATPDEIAASRSPAVTKAVKASKPRAGAAAAFDVDAAVKRLNSFDSPLTRDEAHAMLAPAGRAQLLAIAKPLSIPGSSKMTKDQLRVEIVEATSGRRQDSISIRGFTGQRPGEGGLPPVATRDPRAAKLTAGRRTPAPGPTDTGTAPNRVRRAEHDAAMTLADLVSDVEEQAAKGASTEALVHRVRNRMKRLRLELVTGPDGVATGYTWRRPDGDIEIEPTPSTLAGDTVEDVELATARTMAAVAVETERMISAGASPREITDRVRAIARGQGVDPVERAGDRVTFDPKQHEALGPITPGASVVVVRPGFVSRRTGNDVTMRRPLVQDQGAAQVSGADGAVSRIEAAYARLPKAPGGDWVSLAALRDELADLDRATVDDALRKLSRRSDVRLIPVDNRKALTDRDRAASLRIGEDDTNVIAILGGGSTSSATRATRSPAVAKATRASASRSAAFDRAAALARLNSFDSPLSREEAHALLASAGKADLLAIARTLSVPGSGRLTVSQLRA